MASQKRSLKAKVEFKQALHDVFHSQLEAKDGNGNEPNQTVSEKSVFLNGEK